MFKTPKIIDSPLTFILTTFVVGPFALPLLWRNPNLSRTTKWLGSIIVIAFTIFLFFFSKELLEGLYQKLEESQTLSQ